MDTNETPKYDLHQMAKNGAINDMKAADPSKTELLKSDDKDRTPLYYAAFHGHYPLVRFICSQLGMDPWLAASRGDLVTLETALLYFPNSNPIDDFGNTPIYYASLCGHRHIVSWLKAHGGVDHTKTATFSGRCAFNALDLEIRGMFHQKKKKNMRHGSAKHKPTPLIRPQTQQKLRYYQGKVAPPPQYVYSQSGALVRRPAPKKTSNLPAINFGNDLTDPKASATKIVSTLDSDVADDLAQFQKEYLNDMKRLELKRQSWEKKRIVWFLEKICPAYASSEEDADPAFDRAAWEVFAHELLVSSEWSVAKAVSVFSRLYVTSSPAHDPTPLPLEDQSEFPPLSGSPSATTTANTTISATAKAVDGSGDAGGSGSSLAVVCGEDNVNSDDDYEVLPSPLAARSRAREFVSSALDIAGAYEVDMSVAERERECQTDSGPESCAESDGDDNTSLLSDFTMVSSVGVQSVPPSDATSDATAAASTATTTTAMGKGALSYRDMLVANTSTSPQHAPRISSAGLQHRRPKHVLKKKKHLAAVDEDCGPDLYDMYGARKETRRGVGISGKKSNHHAQSVRNYCLAYTYAMYGRPADVRKIPAL